MSDRMLPASGQYSGLAGHSTMLPPPSAHRSVAGNMGVRPSAPTQLYMSFE